MRTLVLAAVVLATSACSTTDKPAAPKPPAAPATPQAAAAPSSGRTAEIKVTEGGFEPSVVKARAGEPLTLVFTRVTDRTCVTAIDIPDEKVKGFELPLGKPVSLTITPARAGVEAFHCSAMGMGGGKIVVE